MWEFPEIRGTLLVPLHKGLLDSFKGLYEGLGFPEMQGTLFWGPYNKDPNI